MLARSPFMLFIATLSLLAQDPNVIRVTTRMVEVNVIVHDRNGPVTGLTRSDFTILDKGKAQKIAFFSANLAAHASVAATAKASTPALPVNVFTNRPAPRTENPSSATVVLLDGLNTRIQDQVYAKQQFGKFLGQIRPDDRIAVYTLGNGLRVLNDFTNDSRRLVAAVAKYQGQNLASVETSEPDPADSGDFDLDYKLNDLFGAMADQAIISRVRLTAAALIAIANHVSHLPGRKNLVWVSSSFPFSLGGCSGENPTNWNAQIMETTNGTQQNCMALGPPPTTSSSAGKRAGGGGGGGLNAPGPSPFMDPSRENVVFDVEIRRAMQALNAANVAIYPVDARGLTSLPKQFTAAMGPISRAVAGGAAPAAHVDIAPTGTSVMEIVAGDTGGRAFYNTNDIQGAIRKAVDDSEVSYTLGFYPDAKSLDSQFHALKVQVDRKFVEVHHRKGYTATPDHTQTDVDREQVVRDALWSPIAATGITVLAKVDKMEQPAGVRIILALDVGELQFDAAEGKRKAEVEIAFEQRSADGRDLGKTEQVSPITLDESRYQSKAPIMVTKTLTPTAEVSEIRVALFDRLSGRVGSLTIPVK
jgi:VWFA-related protein